MKLRLSLFLLFVSGYANWTFYIGDLGFFTGSVVTPSIWYTILSNNTVFAVSTNNGRILWNYNVTYENSCPSESLSNCYLQPNMQYDAQSGNIFVAAVATETTVFPRPAAILAFNQAGQLVWNASLSLSFTLEGVALATTPGIVYALADNYHMVVTAFDAKTGEQLWQSPNNKTLDIYCAGGHTSWGLQTDGASTVVFNCGPSMIAWDTKGNLLWDMFSYSRAFYKLFINPAPFNTLLYVQVTNSCLYDLQTLKELWCIGGVIEGFVAISPKDGSMLTPVFLDIQPDIWSFSMASYDREGQYQWTSPFIANFTGQQVILPIPIYGMNDLWYWTTGQNQVLFAFEPATGKVVVDDPYTEPWMEVVHVDESGNVFCQGFNYISKLKFPVQ